MKKLFAISTLCVAAFLNGCSQIDTGNVGVERTLGKVNADALTPGVYFTIFKSVDEFTAKEVSFALENLTPKSRDNLTMKDVDIDIYYKTTPSAIPGLFIKYQGDVVRHDQVVANGTSDLVVAYNRVLREAREAAYKAFASFDATTMHTKRAELSETVRATLQKELDNTDPGSFIITAVNVRNLLTDPAIENAIRQRAETDQAIERKIKEVELARAEAERLSVEAAGQAAANNIINQSLTPALERIKIAELQRDTAMAIATKAGNTVLMGSAAQPVMMVK